MKHLEEVDPLLMLLVLGGMGALAGYAALLRSNATLDTRSWLSAVLNSFFLSIAAGSACYAKYGTENKWLTIVLVLVAAMGGNKFILLAVALLEKWVKRIFGLNGDSNRNDPR